MVWALGIVKQEEAFFFSLWDMKRKKTLQTITTYFKMYWETWGGKEMRQDFCKEGCSQTICTAQCEMHTGLLMSAGCKSVPHPLPPATPNWVCIQIVQVVFASESSQKKRRATAVCAHQGGQSVLQCQLWHCQTQDGLSCLSLTAVSSCFGCSSLNRMVLPDRTKTRWSAARVTQLTSVNCCN